MQPAFCLFFLLPIDSRSKELATDYCSCYVTSLARGSATSFLDGNRLSNHYHQYLLCPDRWHIAQHNVLISDPQDSVFRLRLDTAHYHDKILCDLCNQISAQSGRFLTSVQSFCFAKLLADLSCNVPLSCPLLCCLCGSFKFRVVGSGLRYQILSPVFAGQVNPKTYAHEEI